MAKGCSNDKKSNGYGFCLGYIGGVAEEDAEDIVIEMLEAQYPC